MNNQSKGFHFFLTMFALGITIAFAFFFDEVAELNSVGFAILMQLLCVVATLASAYNDYLSWFKNRKK